LRTESDLTNFRFGLGPARHGENLDGSFGSKLPVTRSYSTVLRISFSDLNAVKWRLCEQIGPHFLTSQISMRET